MEYSGALGTFLISAAPRKERQLRWVEMRNVPGRKPWVSSWQSLRLPGTTLGIALLLSLSTSTVATFAGQSSAPRSQAPTFGVRVDLVSLEIEVLDQKGNPVRGLKKEDFQIKEDGKLMEITNFGRFENRSVSLVLVLDSSGLPLERLLAAKAFSSRLIHLLAQKDEIALYSYNEKDAFLEQDFTTDRGLIIEALNNIYVPSKTRRNILKEAFSPSPPSGLSVDLALMRAREGRNDRKAVLLISERFRGLGPAVVEHAQEAGLTVLTVRLEGDSAHLVGLPGKDNRGQLIATESGGREFGIAPEDLAEVCRSIVVSLKNYYHAVYRTEVRSNGGRARKIDVAVPGRVCTAHARRGYFPSR